jgi:hypothetical protein
MTDPKAILSFMTAGKATITLVGKQERFTYKVSAAPKRKPTDPDTWFVSLLNGPDNYLNYAYIGILQRGEDGRLFFKWTSKARVGETALSVRGFKWAIVYFADNRFPKNLEVYHEGRCGRCGRKLTVPESITSGFGPECIGLVGPVIGLEEEKDNAEERGLHFDPQVYLGGEATPVLFKLNDFGFRGAHDTKAVKAIGGYAAARALYAPAKKITNVTGMDAEIRRRVAEYKAEAPENYWQDGELRTEREAFSVAYNKFREEVQAEMNGGRR